MIEGTTNRCAVQLPGLTEIAEIAEIPPTHGAGLAFDTIVNEFQSPLINYAARMLRDRELAQDAVQEAFLRYLKEPPPAILAMEPDEARKNLKSWFFRVTHNLCIDHIRRESRRRAKQEQIETTGFEPPASVEIEAADTRELVRRTLDRLSENQRRVLSLRIFEEKSYKEISALTGLSVSNVGFHIFQGLKKVTEILKVEVAK